MTALNGTGQGQPSMESSILERFNFTVVAVLFVFFFLYYVDIACVIVPWLSYSVDGVLNFLVLTTTTGTALVCYFLCMFTDPGRVPDGWQPDEEQQGIVQEVKKKDGAPRFCKKCNQYKPPRSHHCRVCERCVLRMDHHCPWVNNCIGHANYRSFFLLLVWQRTGSASFWNTSNAAYLAEGAVEDCSAALVHSTGLLVCHFAHIAHSSQTTRVIRVGPHATPHTLEGDSNSHLLLHIGLQSFAFAVALPTSIAVVMLLVWHIRMVATNKTTIEHAEGVTAQIKAAAFGQDRHGHPYDLGLCDNWHEIFGEHAHAWCLPSCSGTPGGLSYPTAFDSRGVLGF